MPTLNEWLDEVFQDDSENKRAKERLRKWLSWKVEVLGRVDVLTDYHFQVVKPQKLIRITTRKRRIPGQSPRRKAHEETFFEWLERIAEEHSAIPIGLREELDEVIGNMPVKVVGDQWFTDITRVYYQVDGDYVKIRLVQSSQGDTDG